MLPIFSKIFEKVVYKPLYTYLNKILSELKHAFIKHKSTVQALLNHMQFMWDSIDSGNFDIYMCSWILRKRSIELIAKLYCQK